ncbi:sigma-70 family RNA polymerase sigma factor [Streptomyces sp. NPDC057257]|uniref:sigma-70 family RNA polymerase sigma factor n=1 Tax=Streptomyces sp. NPDC057257 TaxID=3346071 RepID=UPI003624B075
MPDGSTAVSAPASHASAATAEYARIYEEQQPRLVAYARSLTRNAWTAEDVVAEAHFRVWRRLATGHEIENVPAYLMTTVRHLATAAGTSSVRETPRDPQADEQIRVGRQAHADDPAEQVSSVDLVVRVLGQLPERWVKALWLSEAEGQPLAAIGPQLGTAEGATAVLLHRAREGMRQAFLRAQTGAPQDPACQVHWARMPAYVRGTATSRQSERLLTHTESCADCRARLASLMTANDRLPALVGPALVVLAVGGTGKFLLGFVVGAAGVVGGSAGASTAGAAGAAASASGGAGAAAGVGGVPGGVSAGGHGAGGLLHGVRHVAVSGVKAPVAVAAGTVVAGAVAVLLLLGPGGAGSIPAQRTPVADGPVAQVPVAEAPVAGPSEGVRGDKPAGDGVLGAGAGEPTVTVTVAGGGSESAGEGSDAGGGGGTSPGGPSGEKPTPSEPAPSDPTPGEPTPTEPTPSEPTPGEPTPSDPEPTKPTPGEPIPSDPAPSDPTPGEPTPSDPAPSQPTPSDPEPTNPTPGEPTPSEPAPSQPTPAEPTPGEPSPTEPTPENPSPSDPVPDEPAPPTTGGDQDEDPGTPAAPPEDTDDPSPAPSTPADPPGDDCTHHDHQEGGGHQST